MKKEMAPNVPLNIKDGAFWLSSLYLVISSSYLSSSDRAEHLSTVGAHHLAKSRNNVAGQRETTIVSQNI